jgi:adenine/guanine phosphoribosyltransferase-like PRPP-binding protein
MPPLFHRTFHELRVQAAFPYIPKRFLETDEDRLIQKVALAVKTASYILLAEQIAKGEASCPEVLGSDRWLVPLPSSKANRVVARLPTATLAASLVARGLGDRVVTFVDRTADVEPAHTARSEGRSPPTVQDHITSLRAVLGDLPVGVPLTLVDDIVSTGSTAMAALQVLRAAGFEGDVRLFAAAHTVNQRGERAVYSGNVQWKEGRDTAWRRADAADGSSDDADVPF